jgi:diguanylate cyclase (GGDEF)-like protein
MKAAPHMGRLAPFSADPIVMKVWMRLLVWFGLLTLNVVAAALGYLTGALAAMTALAIALVILLSHSRSTVKHLREQATTDALTGLANYRKLIDSLGWEIARSGRTRGLFSVLFVDMVGLKRINDRHGHVAGSWALCRLAEALRRSCRTVDTPARFGGDEFAIILPETTQAGAEELAARLCAQLAADPRTPALSISVGIAEFPRDGVTAAALLASAGRDLCDRKSWQLESGDRTRRPSVRQGGPETGADRAGREPRERVNVNPKSALAARFEKPGRTPKPS